jgi:hypothetical protein
MLLRFSVADNSHYRMELCTLGLLRWPGTNALWSGSQVVGTCCESQRGIPLRYPKSVLKHSLILVISAAAGLAEVRSLKNRDVEKV